ncbi:MAG: hypothetical protein WC633_01250 [Desulfurivibrionaceae bacterium]
MKNFIKKTLGFFRWFAARLRLIGIKDGIYRLPFPIYHSSLRIDRSKTYDDDVRQFGKEVADRWSRDGCGIASIKCAITSHKRRTDSNFGLPSVATMAEVGVASGGYLNNVGWIHRYLVELAREVGLLSKNVVFEHHLCLCDAVRREQMPIASVTYRFRGGEEVVDASGKTRRLGKGGHLVVITGFVWKGGRCDGFLIDDPQDLVLVDDDCSTQIVSVGDFEKSYSKKAIYVW